MITTLVIFCQLAVWHVHGGPSRINRLYRAEIENWSLIEAQISVKLPDQSTITTSYDNGVQLVRYDHVLCIDAIKGNNDEARNILCFEGTDLHALFDDTIYAMTQNSDQFIRMKLADRSDANYFRIFFDPQLPDRGLVSIGRYEIVKIIKSDDSGNVKHVVPFQPVMHNIYFHVYAEFMSSGHDTGKRRFVIDCGIEHEQRGQSFTTDLLAVFNGGEYNFTWLNDGSRFIFEVRLDGFPERIYYGLTLSHYDNMSKEFAEEMRRYVSPNIPGPDVRISVAEHL